MKNNSPPVISNALDTMKGICFEDNVQAGMVTTHNHYMYMLTHYSLQ